MDFFVGKTDRRRLLHSTERGDYLALKRGPEQGSHRMSSQTQVKKCHACWLCFCDLLFCVMSIALRSTQGDVLTEERKIEKIGKTVTLKCVLQKHYDVLQVTWQKRGKTLDNVATYSAKGVNVTNAYKNHINITLLRLNETAITLLKTTIQDEGCYLCIFNTFPLGSIQGTTCLSFYGDILTEEKIAVKLGKAATLKCTLLKHADVGQVTWQKVGTPLHNVATYSTMSGVKVNKDYQDKLNFTLLGMNETAITLWRTSIQDEGCYLCLFNIYPSGSIRDSTCLSVYEQPWGSLQYTISNGQLNATCIATGWPAPILSWPKMEEKPRKSSMMENVNGTVTVISWVAVNDSQSFLSRELVCRAQQNQNEFFYRKVVEKTRGLSKVSIALIATAVSLSVLVVILLVVYCVKCRRM